MPLKFRLKGLAETFVDLIQCPKCKHDGGDGGDEGFKTDLSRVTFDGIVVVIQCEKCSHVFVPDRQRFGVINIQKLRRAVEKDCKQSGEPLFPRIADVRLDVERLNAEKGRGAH